MDCRFGVEVLVSQKMLHAVLLFFCVMFTFGRSAVTQAASGKVGVVQRTSQVLHVHFLGNIGADQSEGLDLGLKPSLESEIRLRENLKFPVWGLRILVSFSFGSSRVGARGHWLVKTMVKVLVSILESTL